MNHYPHHIGDFDKATRHLSRIERSIYRDLIELYYDTEEPLTLDRKSLCRRILAKSNEETTAVEQMLNEFFNETPTGWFHTRCDTEIEKYRNNSSAAAKAGRASAAVRALKAQRMFNGCSTNAERIVNGCSTNAERIVNEIQPTGNREPGTGNRELEPEPKTKESKSKAIAPMALLAVLGITDQLATDFVKLRTSKKSPITQTAMEGIDREAKKAGIGFDDAIRVCCERGWAGFQAEWFFKDGMKIPDSAGQADRVRAILSGGKNVIG